jgi:hypothetical protein
MRRRRITMPFKIWDNHFGGYMRDFDGGDVAEFQEKVDADRAIELFIRTRDRQDEWFFRLDVVHLASNLRYHLDPICRGDTLLYCRPALLPLDYRVPKSHWKLFAEDGSELRVGMTVQTWRHEEVELVAMTPPHTMASSGEVTCVDRRGHRNWWYPGVIDASYRYAPPEDSFNAAALRWASAEKWDPPRPFDIPAARKLLLPRLIWESPREESPSG